MKEEWNFLTRSLLTSKEDEKKVGKVGKVKIFFSIESTRKIY